MLLIINYLLMAGLLISYSAAWVSPEKWWFPAFMGLGYPFLFLANLFFVIFWLFFRKWYFLLSLIIILIGWNRIWTNIQFNPREAIQQHEEQFKVMSFNARLFRIFNVRKDEIVETRHEFMKMVRQEKPEVICFQEFYSNPYNEDDMMTMLTKHSGYRHYHLDDFMGGRHGIHHGLAIFSKYPIVNQDRFQFRNSTNNYLVYSDIKINNDTIRFCNLHFESIRLDKEDYLFIDEITSNRENKHNWVNGVKMIFWKLKLAFEKRAVQVNQTIEQLKQSPYPIILCGDFNDTPSSYTYHKMASIFNDAFVEAGNGFGRTYAGAMPSYRIDFIMYDDHFKAVNFETLPVDISDHYPVVSNFVMNDD